MHFVKLNIAGDGIITEVKLIVSHSYKTESKLELLDMLGKALIVVTVWNILNTLASWIVSMEKICVPTLSNKLKLKVFSY